MKNGIITLLFILVSTTGFSQNYKFQYTGRFTPQVKKEKLNEVNFVSEITPELWSKMQLRYDVRGDLDLLRKTDFSQSNYIQPNEYDYNKIIDYVSVEILASTLGKTISARSTGNQLTPEQKQLLKTADIGTDINIKIDFKFKNQLKNNLSGGGSIKKGELSVAVVPDTEAEYPGGYAQLSDYFNKNVFNKISEKSNTDKILMASVQFTINEDGQITDTKISRTSTDVQLDKLILDQTKKMPKWKPAKNSEGIKIKQEFSIPFGGGGC